MSEKTKFIELKNVFKRLMGPKGCPWDKKQTHESLIRYLREESRELIAAIRTRNSAHMKEELGDVLLQVMLHAQIASRDKKFDIEDVIDVLVKKMKRRHPHVFGNAKVISSAHVVRNWKKIKEQEKKVSA